MIDRYVNATQGHTAEGTYAYRASDGVRGRFAGSMSRRNFVGWAVCAVGSVGMGGLLEGCSAGAGKPVGQGQAGEGQTGLRSAQDMGGRSVSVPSSLDRIFCTNPIGTADIFTLAPDKLVGWSQKPSGEDAKYIPKKYLSLPSLGVWRGSGAAPNVEEIAKQDPQALLCFWTADKVGRSMADKINGDTGLPVVLIDYDIRHTPDALRFTGNLIGSIDRAEELATYCEDRLAHINRIAQAIPASEIKSIFLSQGKDGLETDPVGSMHVSDALALIRTRNVADMPGTKGKGMGMPTANLEQIIEWNPSAILVSEHGTDKAEGQSTLSAIQSDPQWANVACVSAGEVYKIPQSPFSWFGRPPSVARLLGCMWLLKVLYPSWAADINMRKETLSFYKTFYRYEGFDDAALEQLLGCAGIDSKTGEKRTTS